MPDNRCVVCRAYTIQGKDCCAGCDRLLQARAKLMQVLLIMGALWEAWDAGERSKVKAMFARLKRFCLERLDEMLDKELRRQR